MTIITNDILESFDALAADAQRFAGLRLILCESDPTKRERIIEAVDKWMESNAMPTDPPTPERVNELADAMILVAANARVI